MWDLVVSVPDHCLSFYFKEDTTCMYENTVKRGTFCGEHSEI